MTEIILKNIDEMGQNWIIIPPVFFDGIWELSNTDAGKLVKSLIKYRENEDWKPLIRRRMLLWHILRFMATIEEVEAKKQ